MYIACCPFRHFTEFSLIVELKKKGFSSFYISEYINKFFSTSMVCIFDFLGSIKDFAILLRSHLEFCWM